MGGGRQPLNDHQGHDDDDGGDDDLRQSLTGGQQQPGINGGTSAGTPSPNHRQQQQQSSSDPPLNTRSSRNRHQRYQPGCLGCLSRVPGVSLASWLIIFIGCACYVGGNLVWIKLTADFVVGRMCPVYTWFVIAVAGFTVILATKFLIVNHYASGATSRHVLVTQGRNCAVRCCDAFFMALAYFCQFLWTLLFTVQVIPLLLLLAMTIFREPSLRSCIDLRHYGMRAAPGLISSLLPPSSGQIHPSTSTPTLAVSQQPLQASGEGLDDAIAAALVSEPSPSSPSTAATSAAAAANDYVKLSPTNTTVNATISYQILGPYRKSAHMCGRDLTNFTERSTSFLISMGFAIVGTIFVLIGNLNFIICLAGNYKHVKEIRHLPYIVANGEDYLISDDFNNAKADGGVALQHHGG